MTDTTSTRPELLPCPFCEGTHVVVCKNDMQHTAYCTDCEAEGPLALSQEDAITAWNRRASSQMGDETLSDVKLLQMLWEGKDISTPAQSGLVEALHKIANPFDHGHCGTCGKECAGATDCGCAFPVWEQDNPIAIARAALSHVLSQPTPANEKGIGIK